MNKAIEQYEAQQTFLREEVAKFGIIDAQFEELLAGRSISLQDIQASQQRVDKIINTIEKLEAQDPTKMDSVKIKEALQILGL